MMNKINDPSVIRQEINLPNPNKPGYLQHCRQCTIQEVYDQFIACLKGIDVTSWGCSAYDNAEWCSLNRALIPGNDALKGQLLTAIRHGGSEGYILEFFILSTETDSYQLITSVKYLCDNDVLWEISQQVFAAITRGMDG